MWAYCDIRAYLRGKCGTGESVGEKDLMKTITLICLSLALITSVTATATRADESDINVFGFFQASLYKQKDVLTGNEPNTFTLQQLNLMLQKGLWQRWSTFINFEFTNSYSSFDNWGTFALEEAWARYRYNRYFRLRLGLLIPQFNSLNPIKNRTPLLPYIIRPLVYETSLQETFPIQEFIPEQAYVQIRGAAPVGMDVKFDYAAYWGNSPNISTNPETGNTGLDTTGTFLFGLRVGARHPNFKVGFSTTSDKTNQFEELEPVLDAPPGSLSEVPRYRTGLDLSIQWRSLEFWSEAIGVYYDEDVPELDVDKGFFYMTLAYTFWEKLLVYVSYTELQSNLTIPSQTEGEFVIGELTSKVPNVGLSFAFNDRVKLKAQFVEGETKTDPEGIVEEKFEFMGIAASVWF
jgi:hypothetical protein